MVKMKVESILVKHHMSRDVGFVSFKIVAFLTFRSSILFQCVRTTQLMKHTVVLKKRSE